MTQVITAKQLQISKNHELNENFFHSYYNIASSYYAIGDYKLSIGLTENLDLNQILLMQTII